MLAPMLVWALAGGAGATPSPCALPDATPLSAELEATYCRLPKEVRTLVERQSACLYFGGEEPYDAQRRAALERALRDSCPGNEARFARLRKRYANDAHVRGWLEDYGREAGFLPSP
ncbi:hypothetical protein [Pseudoxanthomonas sp. X-1]|uniref:hypothetical protein n=1 Tax=Pseudoxanthomonas sp. X-1 TaxID=2571115 RepID=UPI00110A17CD|nr:hypothetical protein [Pseudoxanthomonas sp. X-1]TMN19542.1 hypothetical protein FF950_10895 [Pseudoxanthomonas sp. X-1]UAY73074.1 hypothetical protein LAJ50_11115 [Pseudoxanthomonas sp. X-1]